MSNTQTDSAETAHQPSTEPPSEQSIFSTLLTPGSSLHPTLLLLLDAAFLALFLLFLSLAIATEGNVHIMALMAIEIALWASVKWCVSSSLGCRVVFERRAQVRERAAQGPGGGGRGHNSTGVIRGRRVRQAKARVAVILQRTRHNLDTPR